MTHFECCICLESCENKCLYYSCGCASGKICSSCFVNIDPSGVCYSGDYEEIVEIITCPVCRVANWKHQFNQILNSLISDWEVLMLEGDDDHEPNPAQQIFIRNIEDSIYN